MADVVLDVARSLTGQGSEKVVGAGSFRSLQDAMPR
jgi:hypothetical protein